jgi:NAD(P)-dependent dehydrogenase (short-subunit alcohol dehydrogenase family)
MVLDGKWALVTGAAKGIGRGIAVALAQSGCNVIVNDYSDRAGAEETARLVRSANRDAHLVLADVASGESVDRMFTEVSICAGGRLDILVNNAGIQTWRPLVDVEEHEWDRVIATNLKGCFLCTQRAARMMRDSGAGGRIINIGSGCNRIGFPRLIAYTASKGGIETFTKVSASELGKYGITVNCVAPGAIETERTKLEAGDYSTTWASATPLGRVGLPEDVGRAVVFFASPLADFVSGQTLGVDGGLFSKPHWPYEW